MENAGERIAELRVEQKGLAKEYEKPAGRTDRAPARRGPQARKGESRPNWRGLAMERTVFRVRIFAARNGRAHGADRIEFLVSPNLGEEPRPLEKVASGGEISRIALALKTCLAVRQARRRVAHPGLRRSGRRSGRQRRRRHRPRLKETRRRQPGAVRNASCRRSPLSPIIIIVVEKLESKGRTVATIEELDGSGRTREVGRMLSGQKLTPEALKHAEQLIKMSV